MKTDFIANEVSEDVSSSGQENLSPSDDQSMIYIYSKEEIKEIIENNAVPISNVQEATPELVGVEDSVSAEVAPSDDQSMIYVYSKEEIKEIIENNAVPISNVQEATPELVGVEDSVSAEVAPSDDQSMIYVYSKEEIKEIIENNAVPISNVQEATPELVGVADSDSTEVASSGKDAFGYDLNPNFEYDEYGNVKFPWVSDAFYEPEIFAPGTGAVGYPAYPSNSEAASGSQDVLEDVSDKPVVDSPGSNDNKGSGDDSYYIGDSIIHGNENNRVLLGGEGNDMIFGSLGDDIIYGAGGDDIIYASRGNDIIFAGEGDDVVFGGDGNDVIYGINGNNDLYGEDGDDIIHGGEGNDTIYGGEGSDIIYGGGGDDIIFADFEESYEFRGNNDIVYAGKGNDKLYAGSGNSQLYGEDGDDELFSSMYGEHLLNGGNGTDSYHFGYDILTGSSGKDLVEDSDGRWNLFFDGVMLHRETLTKLDDNVYGRELRNGRVIKLEAIGSDLVLAVYNDFASNESIGKEVLIRDGANSFSYKDSIVRQRKRFYGSKGFMSQHLQAKARLSVGFDNLIQAISSLNSSGEGSDFLCNNQEDAPDFSLAAVAKSNF